MGFLLRLSLGIVLASFTAQAAPRMIQGMYVNTYGESDRPPLIFIHGGPGYHSWDFELTTASKLADRGYYVVVYDERGQGRSEEADTKEFNYRRYADDLKTIIDTLHLKDPVLLAHSHGGLIAIQFEEYYPGVARKIALISAPINLWGSFRSILENCARYYSEKGDKTNLDEVTQIYYSLFLDTSVPAEYLPGYVSATFGHGMRSGLYSPKHPTAHAVHLRDLLKQHPLPGPLSGQATAVGAFIKNENYIHFDGTARVYENRHRYCGIYGDEDGIFTPLELSLVRTTLERGRFEILRGASHALYIDQQETFFHALEERCL